MNDPPTSAVGFCADEPSTNEQMEFMRIFAPNQKSKEPGNEF
jgi:hypothetical protein